MTLNELIELLTEIRLRDESADGENEVVVLAYDCFSSTREAIDVLMNNGRIEIGLGDPR